MKIGFSTMNNDIGMPPQRLAVALEERGFDSFWVGEHSHLPVSTVPPYGRTGPLPETYRRMMDPFVTLTAAAVSTQRLEVGTSVALANERDPFNMAKAAATLDLVSEGRFSLGVGIGWNQPEYYNHTSVPWKQRHRLLRDQVGALRALWTQEEASYQGEFISFDAVWSYPKPVQKPHPPILVGSSGPLGIAHLIEWADGWTPLVNSFDQFEPLYALVLEEADRAGRDPASIQLMVSVDGTPDPADLERFRDAGIPHIRIAGHPTMSELEADVMRRLDETAELIARLR